jgi:hypothetical protein
MKSRRSRAGIQGRRSRRRVDRPDRLALDLWSVPLFEESRRVAVDQLPAFGLIPGHWAIILDVPHATPSRLSGSATPSFADSPQGWAVILVDKQAPG